MQLAAVIREAMMDVLANAAPGKSFCIRNTSPKRWRGSRAAVIGALGAEATMSLARRAGDLSDQADLAKYWRGWLAPLMQSGALAMCHPSSVARSVEPFRLREFLFLGSSQFADILAEYHIMPMSWSRALAVSHDFPAQCGDGTPTD